MTVAVLFLDREWDAFRAYARELWARRQYPWADYGREPLDAITWGRAAEAATVRAVGADPATLRGPGGRDGGVDLALWGRTVQVRFNLTPTGDLWFDPPRPFRADIAVLCTGALDRSARDVVLVRGWCSRRHFEAHAHPPRTWAPRGPGVLCLEQAELLGIRRLRYALRLSGVLA